MSEELENRTENTSGEQKQTEGSREGYRSTNYSNYRAPGRSPRPRIHTPRPFVPKTPSNDDEEGFRPEGFGSGLQQDSSQQHTYRPRNNYGQQGGYQPRPSYGRRPQGNYRPRYNNEGEDGYQQHDNDYQSRPSYGQRPQGGYRQRFSSDNENNYQSRENAYTAREGGYQPRENGYQSREGGYQPRSGGYNNQRGGYGNPRGGYNNQRGGYGNPRGGYNNQRGGYGNPRGGYQPRPQGGFRPRTADYDPNAKYNMKKRIEYKEMNIDPNEPIRLNKYLANAGVCSRREADEFIQAGVITVNGKVVTELGTKVNRTDEVKFHDNPVTLEKKVYVLLNKPKDYVTTSDDPQQRKTVMDLVKNVCPERIYPVGRLDRNTTGVLLLTNDGDLASKLTHPKFLKKKVYHVFLDKNVAAEDMQRIREGVELDDGEVHADAIDYANDTDRSQVGVEIHSGKNRIVRRIFESLGYHVVKLDRVQFAGLTKKNLRRGDWRFLTEKEVDMLRMGAFE